jgi:hypothetical protein
VLNMPRERTCTLAGCETYRHIQLVYRGGPRRSAPFLASESHALGRFAPRKTTKKLIISRVWGDDVVA